jgi:hypothetical protein
MQPEKRALFKIGRWHLIGAFLLIATVFVINRFIPNAKAAIYATAVVFACAIVIANIFFAYKKGCTVGKSAGVFLNILAYMLIALAIAAFVLLYERIQRQ